MAIAVLLAAAGLGAQTVGPLGRNPRPKPPPQPSFVILVGELANAGSERLELRVGGRTLLFRVTGQTSFETYRSSLKPGDLLRIEARPAGGGAYIALRVERSEPPPEPVEPLPGSTVPPSRLGTPADYEEIPALDEDDPRRPVLRRHPGRSSEPEFVPDPEFGAGSVPEARRADEVIDEDEAFADFPPPPPLHPDPVIAAAMRATESFSERLPNFICEERMTRLESGNRGKQWKEIDVVEVEVLYVDGKESYRNIRVNGKPSGARQMSGLSGAWSTGEYGTTLRAIFAPGTQTEFTFREDVIEKGQPLKVYDFHVAKERSNWHVAADKAELLTEYRGAAWIDEETGRILRLEMEAINVPSSFPMNVIESTVEYGGVMIAGEEYLLPVFSENLGCRRAGRHCMNNRLEFFDYRKFTASSSVFHTESEIDFGGEAPEKPDPEQNSPPSLEPEGPGS